ncbi:response regulator receiver protein [Trichodesmium erythraeum IMS101]|uniref:Protein PatA n=1 Tax=Trichodesmium erythraeum (strain IMS101) TaxID=203124 RepID=Q118C3_TRIEI|nr:response regulator [Trichodesmium erythraeum GBRTRLIN201]MCH2048530.1 response regulator [Trichodesmium sp. ALOHA_ZT_67]MDT9338459.1 response regulator [Trichodesmium erythraeum 21-75]
MSANKQLIKLAKILDELSQLNATGKLLLNSLPKERQINLSYGRILYSTSEIHRVRRWERRVKLYCPKWNPITSQIQLQLEPYKPWEYLLLYDGISKNQITVAQAKAVIRTVTLEILFSISYYPDLIHKWEENPGSKSELSLGLSLSYSEIKPIFAKVAQIQYLSRKAGFENLNLNLVPVPKKPVASEALSGFGKYLQGDLTLWDIVCKLQKSILVVTHTLLPLVKKGLVQLQTISDLPGPNFTSSLAKTNSHKNRDKTIPKKKPLIACIDDSKVVAETLRKIVEPAGYNLIGIQDPIKGFVKIAEHKPDLIFLDLEMPNANGYNVYQFLHNTPAFKKIPVIILTSKNNLIDRSRAKLIGTADFLNKPPKPEAILKIIKKHLSVTPKFN